MTTKVGSRAVRVKIFLMAVDPSGGPNKDIYDDFKLKKNTFGCVVYKFIQRFNALRVKTYFIFGPSSRRVNTG